MPYREKIVAGAYLCRQRDVKQNNGAAQSIYFVWEHMLLGLARFDTQPPTLPVSRYRRTPLVQAGGV